MLTISGKQKLEYHMKRFINEQSKLCFEFEISSTRIQTIIKQLYISAHHYKAVSVEYVNSLNSYNKTTAVGRISQM